MTKQPLQKLFDAMYHGKYSFEDFLQSPVEKNYEVLVTTEPGGRRLFKPKENLKTYHRFLNLFLFEFLPVNDRVVFSYRKGFSALNAVQTHAQSKFFYQTDIQAFFDSIDRALTEKTILSGQANCPISDLDIYLDRIVDLVCIDNSLPVGLWDTRKLQVLIPDHKRLAAFMRGENGEKGAPFKSALYSLLLFIKKNKNTELRRKLSAAKGEPIKERDFSNAGKKLFTHLTRYEYTQQQIFEFLIEKNPDAMSSLRRAIDQFLASRHGSDSR